MPQTLTTREADALRRAALVTTDALARIRAIRADGVTSQTEVRAIVTRLTEAAEAAERLLVSLAGRE